MAQKVAENKTNGGRKELDLVAAAVVGGLFGASAVLFAGEVNRKKIKTVLWHLLEEGSEKFLEGRDNLTNRVAVVTGRTVVKKALSVKS